jgi:hypothetical protein
MEVWPMSIYVIMCILNSMTLPITAAWADLVQNYHRHGVFNQSLYLQIFFTDRIITMTYI